MACGLRAGVQLPPGGRRAGGTGRALAQNTLAQIKITKCACSKHMISLGTLKLSLVQMPSSVLLVSSSIGTELWKWISHKARKVEGPIKRCLHTVACFLRAMRAEVHVWYEAQYVQFPDAPTKGGGVHLRVAGRGVVLGSSEYVFYPEVAAYSLARATKP